MSPTKIKASKLQNVEVTHISLVDRGANRIPFKIIKEDKQEKSMFNLSTIFKSEKTPAKKEETLKVSAIAIKKSEGQEEIKAALKAEGFNVDNVEELEDSIIYKQEDFRAEEVKALKMNDGMVILTKGFSTYNLPQDSSFFERAEAMNFFPSMQMAGQAIVEAVYNILNTSNDSDEIIAKSEVALTDFHSYSMLLIGALPRAAFKAEKAIAEITKSYEGKKKMTPEEEKAKAKKDEGTTEAVIEPVVVDTHVIADPAVSEPVIAITAEVVAEIAQKAVSNGLISLEATVTKALEAITKQVLDMAKSQEAVAKQLSEVEAVAKSAQSKLKGITVQGDTMKDDTNKTDNVVKFEALGLIDTAFQPELRKKSHK